MSTSRWRRSWRALARFWPLLLPIWLYLPGLFAVAFPGAQARFTDLLISHYPNAVFLRRALLETHAVPLWSPLILSGYPFAADPLSGLWYPPGWLALALPLPQGFAALVMLHLLWGGLGVYRLARREGAGHAAALTGGLIFVAMPRFVAQFAAGHVTLLYASAWLPWVLLASGRAAWRAGALLALTFLADPRMAVYAGGVWLVYDNAHSHIISRKVNKFAIHIIKTLTLTTLLSAPLALPLWEYARLSTRAALQAGEGLVFSLPPARLLGLLFPDFGGFQEWMLYLGGAVALLALAGLMLSEQRRSARFWVFIGVGALLLSLGEYLPFLSSLFTLPGLSWMRVPPRSLTLAGLAAAMLAVHGVEALLNDENVPEKGARRFSLTAVALAAFGVALAFGARVLTGRWGWSYPWGAGALVLGALGALTRLRGRLPAKTWMTILYALILFDLGVVGLSQLDYRPLDVVMAEGEAAAEYLADQPGVFRVYSPSYSLPQHTAARYDLELADGVDPLQLAAYVEYMTDASGVPQRGYSVTLPPFAGGEPRRDNAAYAPDAAALGMLNVRYVAAGFELDVPRLEPVARFGETHLYLNARARPRAWVERTGGEWRAAEVTYPTPNRMVVRTVGPGRLVLAELAYPGWRAWLDGEPVAWDVAYQVLRAVDLPSGEHVVAFRFQPRSVYLGLALWGVGMALVMLAWRAEREGRRG